MRRLSIVLTFLLASWLNTALAEEQDAQDTSDQRQNVRPQPSVQAPDVVVTRAGGLYRGTISEKTAEYVQLLLITGDLRTIPMAEVEYAGPAEGLPQQQNAAQTERDDASGAQEERDGERRPRTHRPRSIVTVESEEAELKLSGASGLTFHRRAASASRGTSSLVSATAYEEVCTVPCEVTMPAGTHTFALSEPGGKPAEADLVTIPPGPSTLMGTYADRSAIRWAGAIISLGGFIAGLALISSGMGDGMDPDSSTVATGGYVMIGSCVPLLLAWVPDDAEVEVKRQRTSREGS